MIPIPTPPKTPNSPPRPARLTSSAAAGILTRSNDNIDTRSIRSAPTRFPAQVTPQSLTEQLSHLSINRPTPMPQFSTSPASSQMEYHSTTPMAKVSPTSSKEEDIEFHSTGSQSSTKSSLSDAHNSMRSNHSQNSHIMAIPRPDLNSVPIFRKWLEHNFMPSYLTGQFLDFLIIHKRCTDMNSLLTFLTFFNASDVHDILGQTIYQEYRHDLIELRVIWDFIQNVFPAFLPNLKGVPWSMFLNHREQVLEKFEQDTPPAIVFDKAYQPPSPAPSYHEVSPQISKNQPYTTPDALFSSGQTDNPNGYLPSNPSVDFIGGEISVLSSRSAGSRKSGRDPPSVAAPDPLPSVVSPGPTPPSAPPPISGRTDPVSHTLTHTDTPSNAGRSSFRPPFHPSLAVSSCSPNQNWSSLRARHHRMSDRQATSTYVPPPAITELSELTPVNSNPRRRVVDRGGVRQTQQDSYEQPSSLAGDPTAEKLYQTYRTPSTVGTPPTIWNSTSDSSSSSCHTRGLF